MTSDDERGLDMPIQRDDEDLDSYVPDSGEIQHLDDGWVWRCWACGSLGSGHYSEAGARGEFDRHPCEPQPSAEATA